jgi:hydroxymethylglutaryl-CoA lyase
MGSPDGASQQVAITETVRDAWQGLPNLVPTAAKIAHVQRLLDGGFRSIDIGSFVSPKAVPAMADTGALMEGLVVPEQASIMALVANARGLEQLLVHERIDEVLFPFSLSETFQQRNTRCSREEALAQVAAFGERAHEGGRTLYVTVSMAFGNNEGDSFDASELAHWLGRLEDAGADRLGLADTTAEASGDLVRQVYEVVAREHGGVVPAVHFHVTPESQGQLVAAAIESGCREFDAALGGLGGCQFARGPESNVSTLPLVQQLEAAGFGHGLPSTDLETLDGAARDLARS